jgi:hypothetical protein
MSYTVSANKGISVCETTKKAVIIISEAWTPCQLSQIYHQFLLSIPEKFSLGHVKQKQNKPFGLRVAFCFPLALVNISGVVHLFRTLQFLSGHPPLLVTPNLFLIFFAS